MSNPADKNLLHCWRRLVAENPYARAVIDGATGRIWTRAELSTAASAWLAALSPETRARLACRRVVLAEPNGPVWFHVLLGLLEIGAIPALADSKESTDRLNTIATASRAAAVWSDKQLTLLAPRSAARRTDQCLIKLTSGSTGIPRVLAFTHAQMHADGAQICAAMHIRADDLNLGVIPLGHSYGLGNLVIPLLVQGTAVLCAASPFPQSLAADCEHWKPTVFPAVPTLLRALANAEIAPASLASVRLVISAGAPLTPSEAVAFSQKFGRRVQNLYGTSETGGITFDRDGSAAELGQGVGTLIDGVRLRWRRGKRFTVESAAVHGRGCYSPPDRAELAANGSLILLGRAGRTLKIAGRRLDPVEVENVLRSLPGVRDAFVTAHPVRVDSVAAAVAADEPLPHAIELRKLLATRTASWKIPDHIAVMSAFPVTQRGKTDRVALLRLFEK